MPARCIACLAVVFSTTAAYAHIPVEYQPLVVEAEFSFSERLFDLTHAVEKSKTTGKPLLIYVGASDCGPCRQFTAFLASNRPALKDSFDKLLVVDVRTWLKGPTMSFVVGRQRYSTQEFKALVGDGNRAFVFPYLWLVDPSLRQVRQLPVGTENYVAVTRLRDLLRISTDSADRGRVF